jgi:hypothetical protein
MREAPARRPGPLCSARVSVPHLAHVYGLRAETIAILRLREQQGFEAQAEEHRQAALRAEAGLRSLRQEYVETYGKRLIAHGGTEFSVER